MNRRSVQFLVICYLLVAAVMATTAGTAIAGSTPLPTEAFEGTATEQQMVEPDTTTTIPFVGYIYGTAETLSVTYHANGGNGGSVVSGMSQGAVYRLLSAEAAGVSWTGGNAQVFTAWNTNADGGGTSYAPGAEITVSDDIHLYAQWRETPAPPTERPTTSDPIVPTEPTPSPDPAETEPPSPTESAEPSETPGPIQSVEPEPPEEESVIADIVEDAPLSEVAEPPASLPPSDSDSLVAREDGTYIEIDEGGVPLGVWSQNEDGEWVFDEYTPLGSVFPKTGVVDLSLWWIGAIVFLVILLLLLLWRRDEEERKARAADEKRQKRRGVKLLSLCAFFCLIGIIGCGYSLLLENAAQVHGHSYYAALSLSNSAAPELVAEAQDDVFLAAPATPAQTKPTDHLIDFEALRQRSDSPDIVLWLQCEDTTIDYPVLQAGDNEYYLNHLPDGTAHKMGALFLDYRNTPDFSDDNSVIYGHHMNNGDMFGDLEDYKDQTFYERHPAMTLFTPEKNYCLELCAGYLFDPAKEVLPLYFTETNSFEAYIREIKERSLFDSDVQPRMEDRLVTLATCTYEFSDARFILVGRLSEL